jgi:HlyD family secretion protein
MKKLLAAIIFLTCAALAGTYLPAHLHKQPASNVLKVSGNIEAHQSDLSFKVQGRIKVLPVQEGGWVHAGAVLARLDDDDYRQQVAADESTLELRQAQLALTEAGSRPEDIQAGQQNMLDAEADLELKKIDVQRKEALYKKDAISAETHDISLTGLKRAQAVYERSKQLYQEIAAGNRKEQIAIDRQTVNQAMQNLQLSRVKLGYTVLRAPVAGVITTREAELGEVVGPGTPVATLADLDNVWLRAYVSETDLGRIRLGQTVQVTTDTYPGKIYSGRLSFISSTAEFTPKSIQTQTERVTLVYRIKIDLSNQNHELKPGMPADAVLDSGAALTNDPKPDAVEGGRPISQERPKVQKPLVANTEGQQKSEATK